MDKYRKAGFKLLATHVKKKYPFIVDVVPDFKNFNENGLFIYFNIVFDLAKFYETTGAIPPDYYFSFDSSFDLLESEGLYLMRYVNSKLKDEYGWEYNDKIKDYMSGFYKNLPQYMRYSILEGFSDEQIRNQQYSLSFGKSWQESLDPVNVEIKNWIPIVDHNKIKELTKR